MVVMPEPIGRVYIGCWLFACTVAVVLAVRARPRLVLLQTAYFRWLFQPWKLATFAVALAGMVLIAPYAGDPTWDYVTGGTQSVLTFLSAPWSVGTIYRRLRARAHHLQPPSNVELYCAICGWMFSVSWFYDGYLYLRDGRYVWIWLENLLASSGLYALAGMLWSVHPGERAASRGEARVWFAFQLAAWPRVNRPAMGRVVKLAAVIMIVTTVLMSPFLLEAYEALTR